MTGDPVARPDAWRSVAAALARALQQRALLGVPYLPVPAVERALAEVAAALPEHFATVELRWAQPRPPGVLAAGPRLLLPRLAPSPAELEEATRGGCRPAGTVAGARLAVARFLAASVLNQRMAFGPGRLRLLWHAPEGAPSATAVPPATQDRRPTPDSVQSRGPDGGWAAALVWVQAREGHGALLHYLQQVATPRIPALAELQAPGYAPLSSDALVVGLDVGRSEVKIGVYGLDPAGAAPGPPVCRGGYPTALPRGERYADGLAFAQRARAEVECLLAAAARGRRRGLDEDPTAQADDGQDASLGPARRPGRIGVVGVAWPGAVAGPAGREYVAGASGILSCFVGLSGRAGQDSAAQLHALALREAFETAFKAPGEPPPRVRLINDGEAHTRGIAAAAALPSPPPLPMVALTAGTGTALGVLGDDGSPLPVLLEAGKLVLDVHAPLPPPSDAFPPGRANRIFSRETLPELAVELAARVADPSARELVGRLRARELGAVFAGLLGGHPSPDALLRSWYDHTVAPQLDELGLRWLCEGRQAQIRQRRETLRRACAGFQGDHALPGQVAALLPEGVWPAASEGLEGLAMEAARRAGCLLADLAALLLDLFGARSVLATGGPMTGQTGRLVRAFAREELQRSYGLQVLETPHAGATEASGGEHCRPEGSLPAGPGSVGCVAVPEPAPAPGPEALPHAAGPWGAAAAALELHARRPRGAHVATPGGSADRSRSGTSRRAPDGSSESSPSWVRLSHFSTLRLPVGCSGRLHFPGRAALKRPSFGYVRSPQRAQAAQEAARRAGETCADAPLPWRDYPPELLVDSRTIGAAGTTRPGTERLVVSARNVLNELGHSVRLQGRWFARAGDPPLDPDWPALQIGPTGLRVARLTELVAEQGDLLTGLPLVRGGHPCGRTFFVAHCSDVAHCWDVDPIGRVGPGPEAWAKLSQQWQDAHGAGLSDDALQARLDATARRLGVGPRQGLLHSVVASQADGTLLLVAVTGALDAIAQTLVERLQVVDALVLDNGGSVGYLRWAPEATEPVLLVAGPNRRRRGTVFLEIVLPDFPSTTPHFALGPARTR